MTEKKLIRSFLKTTAIIVSVLAVLLVSFHFWFREHAEEVIEEMVSARSKGKVNLKLKKFRFNYFSRKMELQNAIFYTTDSINAPTAYVFKIYKVNVEVESFWQLVFNGKLTINSLTLTKPDIEAIQIRADKDPAAKNVSISQEMGRIYNSIHDALEYLGAKRFLIDEGKFSLINRIVPGKVPVTISHIHFLVDNTDTISVRDNKLSYRNSDNMILRSHDQDISLPDGRHRLNFRSLRINIKKQSIEMDSCTISAGKSEISQAAFTIFFDTLRMSSVDFSTLYKNDLIKADSVYCTQPRISLQLALKDKGSVKKPPSLKKILQPLTGDLQLGYVGILNASMDIVTTRNDHTTTFTSEHDNIEIEGLHINSDSTDPLVVKNFLMSIRDYETLSRDSTLAFRFDSIKFNNSKVVLSNFTVRTQPGNRSINVERTYTVPRLELTNLSWDELLFNRNIKASKAILYYPVINYKRIKPRIQNRRLTFFRDLGNIDAITELQQLQVVDGQLNMQLDPRTKITVQDADVIVSSNELLGSRNIKSIQRSINQVSFDKGILSINDLKVEFHHVHFTGKEDQLEAEEVTVYDPAKTLSAIAKNVVINELYYNDSTKSISVDGLEWQQATVNLGALSKESKPSKSSIAIKNISGNNTILFIQNPDQSINTTIQSISIDEMKKPVNEKTTIYGLHAIGNNFSLTRNSLWIEAGAYDISDKKKSIFSDACLEQTAGNTLLTTIIPSISFTPDIQEIMKDTYHFGETTVADPLIYIKRKNVAGTTSEQFEKLADFYFEGLTFKNPLLLIQNEDSSGNTFIRWNRDAKMNTKNEWRFTKIKGSRDSATISLNGMEIDGSGFSYTGNKGSHYEIENSEVHAEAENILIAPPNKTAWEWSGKIKNASVKNLNHFNIKNKGVLTIPDASAGNINLSSSNVKTVSAFLSSNSSFQINNSGGNYIDSNNTLSWSGLTFDQDSRSLSINAVVYKPSLSKDSFVMAHPYQVDYITATTGPIHLDHADLASYIIDSTLKAGKLVIQNPIITAYRDATKPFKHGNVKYLPSLMIKRFPPLFSFDTIQLKDATITYSQVDIKTGKTGTVPLTHLNATLSPVRNYDLGENDSLELKAEAILFDKATLRLIARESYSDSLAGIHMELKTGNADLSILNPAIIPLVSAKIKSGHIDTLHMNVKANEYSAYGEMKMNYSNLKIGVLKKGNENSKTITTRLANFVANTFLLKHKNKNKRTGIVYFERLRERSFFNYLVKMTISGIAYTIGIKKDKKGIREYKRKKNV